MIYPYAIIADTKTSKKITERKNNLEFNIELNDMLNLVQDRFEYKGLPETCDVRYLELSLIYRAFAGFKRKEDGSIWNYSAGPGGHLTQYGYPSDAYLYALNGTVEYGKVYWPFMDNTGADTVLCLDNYQCMPPIYKIIDGAEKIADARRSLDVAIKNSKRPFIFNGTEEQVNTIKSLFNDMYNNEPYLIANKSTLDNDKPQVQSTNFHEGVIKELWDAYNNVKGDIYQRLGINMNVNSDKKERMTEAEVTGDTEFVNRVLETELKCRKEFCDRINEAFGLNVSVKIKEPEREEVKDYEQNEDFGSNTTNED